MKTRLPLGTLLICAFSAAAETIVITTNEQQVDLFAHPNDTVQFAGTGLKTSSVLGEGKAYGSGILSVADGAELSVDSDLGPATLRLEGGSTVVFPRSASSMTGFAGLALNGAEGTETKIEDGVLQLIGSSLAGFKAVSAWSPVEFPVTKPFRATFKCRLSGFCGLSFMVQKAESGTGTVGTSSQNFTCGAAGVSPSVGIAMMADGTTYDSAGGWVQDGVQKDWWRISYEGWSKAGFCDVDLSVTVEYAPVAGKLYLTVVSPNEASPYSKAFACGSIAETLGATSGLFGFTAGSRTPGGSVRVWDFSFASDAAPVEPDMTQTSAQWTSTDGQSSFTTYGDDAKAAFRAKVDNSRNGARQYSVFHHTKMVAVTVPFTVKARIAFPSFCGGIAFLFHNEATGSSFKGTGDNVTDPAVENMGFRTTATDGTVTATTAWGMGIDLRLGTLFVNGRNVKFAPRFRAVRGGDFVKDYAPFSEDGIVFSADDPSVTNEVELTLAYDLTTLTATLKSGEHTSVAVFTDAKTLYERMGGKEAYFCISDGLMGSRDSGRGCWITDLTYDFGTDFDRGLTIRVAGAADLNAKTGETVAFPGSLMFEGESSVLSLTGTFTADAPISLTVPAFSGLSRDLVDLSAASGLTLDDFVLNDVGPGPGAGVRLKLRNGVLSACKMGGLILQVK